MNKHPWAFVFFFFAVPHPGAVLFFVILFFHETVKIINMVEIIVSRRRIMRFSSLPCLRGLIDVILVSVEWETKKHCRPLPPSLPGITRFILPDFFPSPTT